MLDSERIDRGVLKLFRKLSVASVVLVLLTVAVAFAFSSEITYPSELKANTSLVVKPVPEKIIHNHKHSIGLESNAEVKHKLKIKFDHPLPKMDKDGKVMVFPKPTIDKVVDGSLLGELSKGNLSNPGENMFLLVYFRDESSKKAFANSKKTEVVAVFDNSVKIRGTRGEILSRVGSFSLAKLADYTGVKHIAPVVNSHFQKKLTDLDKLHHVMIHYSRRLSDSEIKKLEEYGAVFDRDFHPLTFAHFVVPENKINEVATLPFVKKISDIEGKTKLALNHAVPMTAVDEAREYWVNEGYSGELNGSGIRVAVVDTGYDEDNPYLKTPVDKKHYYECITGCCTNDDITDEDGHGTHVAGVIVSNHTSYNGIASGIDLIYLKSEYTSCLDNAIRDAIDVYDADIISLSIHPDSDDANLFGTDEWDRAVDYASRQGAMVFIAAGNGGSDGLWKLGDAKNAVIVGATGHWGAEGVADIDKVTAYSGMGDTDDGRDKPDIVAPGGSSVEQFCKYEYGMISTKSSDADYSANYGLNESCWVDDDFIKLSGTSQSAPVAAGIGALYLQAYPELFNYTESRAALLKARMMVSALSVDSTFDGSDPDGWNNYTGFGKVDLHNGLLSSTGTKVVKCWNSSVGQNEIDPWEINLPVEATEFKIVLVWSDPQSESTDPEHGALLNDIDLFVTDPSGTTTYSSTSPTNPVEYVTIADAESGWWEVNITGQDYFDSTQTYGLCYMYYLNDAIRLHLKKPETSAKAVAPGESFTLKATVANWGSTSASGVEFNLSYDSTAFNLVNDSVTPLLGDIGGSFEERSHTWTLEAKEDATRADYDFTVYAVDSTESYYSNSRTVSDFRILEYELTPTLEYQSFNVSPESNFGITVHVNNTGDLNATDVNATLNLPEGLSTADDLTQTIEFIEIDAIEDATWSVSTGNEGTYPFTVDIEATPYDLQYTRSVLGCVAVSSDGTNYCNILYSGWNLVSLPLNSTE